MARSTVLGVGGDWRLALASRRGARVAPRPVAGAARDSARPGRPARARTAPITRQHAPRRTRDNTRTPLTGATASARHRVICVNTTKPTSHIPPRPNHATTAQTRITRSRTGNTVYTPPGRRPEMHNHRGRTDCVPYKCERGTDTRRAQTTGQAYRAESGERRCARIRARTAGWWVASHS